MPITVNFCYEKTLQFLLIAHTTSNTCWKPKEVLMLDKRICKACCQKSVANWNRCDEIDWEKGAICCSAGTIAFTDKRPPRGCPYELEHLIALQNGIEQGSL